MSLSPMMQQYLDIKEQHKDSILFFRLGDFYEMFFDDAKIVSKELELVLTGKSCGLEERAPMCGVPFHSCDTYIARLIEKGYKVAICEQVEDPKECKGLVKREVVQIITPGTLTKQSMLDERENNYLASIFMSSNCIALAYCDVSTGEFFCTDFSKAGGIQTVTNEIVRLNAKELILTKECYDELQMDEIIHLVNPYVNILDDSFFSEDSAKNVILKQLNLTSLMGIGLGDKPEAISAAGSLLMYIFETQKQSLTHINKILTYQVGSFMALDKATIRNLELTETLYDKKVKGSLLGILDKTHTAMGSRKIRQWIREPLNRVSEINRRLDGVEQLYNDVLLRNNLKTALKEIYDLERLVGRISFGSANGKDLIALKYSLASIPEIKGDLCVFNSGILFDLNKRISDFLDIHDLIENSIKEDAVGIKEGNVIKDGFNDELDDLKLSIKDAKEWIANLEGAERERTGIKNLKVGFNKVFGYYIEITKSNYNLTPDNYIRKQTLVNCERFITPELKEMESLVFNAESKINQLEYTIFTEIRKRIQQEIPLIQETAIAIAELDALISFADVSAKLGYIKPIVNDQDEIYIKGGKHPVIEQTISDGMFVSNDAYTNCSDTSMLLITGPNMAGKSTYMRQNALIVLMAQAGCFVPCEYAKIGVVDRIFTRIGASDNLSQGQSTFFVEMSELAYILNCSTDKSLIILDEIGRGTSTYDGLSIAWAVVEYLCSSKKRCRTFFATHYHELTALEGQMAGCKNLNVDVAEENGNVLFLHKIVEGSASRSYGIHVAKLAGVPTRILKDAESKLQELENNGQRLSLDAFDIGINKNISQSNGDSSSIGQNGDMQNCLCDDNVEESQLSFFSLMKNPIVERLKALDLMEIRPSEAVALLEELQELAKKL